MSKYQRARFEANSSVNFQSLTDDEREEIYMAALEILERTGVKVFSEEAREIYAEAGCWIEDDELVKIPIGLSQWAVDTAPSKITLYDQEGNAALDLHDNKTYFGPGPTNTYHRDPYTGERRRPVNQDNRNAAKVCDALDNIDYVMDLGTPSDVTENIADIYAFKAMLENTNKPIVHWGFDIEQYEDMIEMASVVAGSLEELQKKPFFFLYSEPTSPLLHSREGIDKVLLAARKRIPIVYTPCIISGATCPATLSATLAQGIAESVAGITLSQLANRGTPIIMGGVYGIMDMNTTIFSYGSPEFNALQAGISEVSSHMGIPVFGTAGCTDSHTIDEQAAAEAAMSILTAAQSGANLVHDCGYMSSGNMGSLEQLVMDNEIIGMVRRFMEGIEVTDETLAVDVVDEVGIGGHFLGEDHTRDHFKDQTWFPELMNRMRHDGWRTKANKSRMSERIRDKLHDILENYEPPALDEEDQNEIDKIMERAEKREAERAEE